MTTGLSLALNKIDDSIVALFRERERLVGAIADETAERSSISPFVVPFAVGHPIQAQPFEPFVPGLHIGYDKTSPPNVMVSQTEEADDLLSPPDHHFVLNFDIRNSTLTPWITLEKTMAPLRSGESARVSIALKARASVPTSLRFEMSVPRVDQDDHRVPLGSLEISERYEPGFLSHTLRLDDVPDIDQDAHPRLIAFLPTRGDAKLSMAYYTTLVSPR